MTGGEIHDNHPFATPEDLRDPVRQFRGRLAAPVTVITSGGPGAWAGLTVSSIVVAEGTPSLVYFLCGTINDVWDRILDTGRFVVHVLEDEHRELSEVFAGYRPQPGGMFASLDVADGTHGPVIESIGTRADVSYRSHQGDELALVEGAVDAVTLHDLTDPLQWFRGSYLG